jgi:hypothetical protein
MVKKTVSAAPARRLKQGRGIIWVDFSLRDVFRLEPE